MLKMRKEQNRCVLQQQHMLISESIRTLFFGSIIGLNTGTQTRFTYFFSKTTSSETLMQRNAGKIESEAVRE